MTNKVHIKMGPIEFEAEGDSDLIQRERESFFSLLPQAIVAVSPVVTKPVQMIDAANSIEELEKTDNSMTLLPNAKEIDNKAYTSIAAFLNEKKFDTEVELVMGVAYFIEIIEQGGYFTAKDIENKLTEARRDKPCNISQNLTQNIKKGFLRECSEKKDSFKAYSVLEEGIKWCETYTPKTNDKKKKNKTARTTTDSSLLSIPLNELNLEKYCDISRLDKFSEQVLVVMLMYTKEKNIEYFSFNDIVAVLKNKFKMSGTSRKVRYVFDNGGTMFDKKVEKKIAYHKLMSSGIKEAERIVAEQRAAITPQEK